MRVREWMHRPVIGVKPRDSAAHARAVMEQRRVNQLPVLEGPRLVGIVTDRDLRDAFPSLAESRVTRGGHADTVDPAPTAVGEPMTRDVLTVEPDATLAEAARLLRRERIGALPVVAAGKPVGILARSDLLDALVRFLADDADGGPARGPTPDGFG
jgi:acetoin utilization protein AcuB